MPRKPEHAKSIVDLSRMVGVNEQTLRQHRSEGCPMPSREEDLVQWVQDYHSWRRQAHGNYHERLQAG